MDGKNYNRPLLPICIEGYDGVDFADSESQACIVGASLYKLLIDFGYVFRKTILKLS